MSTSLKQLFDDLRARDPRVAAEVAYVLAVLADRAGKKEEARSLALESIHLFETVGVNSLDDATAHYTVLEDVAIPSYIHADVIRDRLKHLDLSVAGNVGR